MTQTVQIEAILLEVTCEVIAEIGDKLIIFNGVCIGVQPKTPMLTIGPLDERILATLNGQAITAFELMAKMGIGKNPGERAAVSEMLNTLADRNKIVGLVIDGGTKRSRWKKA